MGQNLPANDLADNEKPRDEFLRELCAKTGEKLKWVKPFANRIDRVILTSGSHVKVQGSRMYIPRSNSAKETAQQLIKQCFAN
jgi:hypothetical protein